MISILCLNSYYKNKLAYYSSVKQLNDKKMLIKNDKKR